MFGSSLGAFAVLSALPAFLATCAADHEGFVSSSTYNHGVYGDYVSQTFVSSNVSAPILNVNKPFTNCDDGSYLFIAPRGEKTPPNPYILDHDGHLVWTPGEHFGEVYNFQVQKLNGQDYLCFWAGNDSIGGHGAGKIYMFDQHYELYRTVVAGNGLSVDLHSFDITASGTAIFTAYEVIRVDLTGVKRKRGPGFIWDSLFQEIDLETNEVIFQWRASEHTSFRDSRTRINKATAEEPWDWFHINSVEKDVSGNYLVSSRYLRAVLYVSGETGQVLWQLGGRSNSFHDLSPGRAATSFLGQHDAHWVDEPVYHGAITLFDNRGDWVYHTAKESQGTRVEVDLNEMKAQVARTYTNEARVYSVSQGSYQTLPNGNVLLGYGINGVVTEFAPDGTMLCDAYFEPAEAFSSGNVQSYRNLKFNWTGIPNTEPSLVLADGRLHMSWLGSTEVRKWLLQDALTADGRYQEVLRLPKSGFETSLGLAESLRVRQFVQVVALDANSQVLATSNPVDIGDKATVFEDVTYDNADDVDVDSEEHDTESVSHDELRKDLEDVQLLIGLGLLAVLSALSVFWIAFGSRVFQFVCIKQLEPESWHCGPSKWPAGVGDRVAAWLRPKMWAWRPIPQHEEQADSLLQGEEREPIRLSQIVVGKDSPDIEET